MKQGWPPRAVRWRHWYHLAALTGVIAGAQAAVHWFSFKSGVPSAGLGEGILLALAGLPPAMYVWLPFIAGVCAGLIRPASGMRRWGVRLVLVVTLAMLVLDIVPSGRTPELGGSTVVNQEGEVLGRSRRPSFAEGSMIRTLGSAALGSREGISERAERYPIGHARTSVARALLKMGLLLATPILVGMVLAANLWIASAATFETPLHERIVRLGMAWFVSPALFVTLFRLSDSARFAALFRDQSLMFILWPHLILGMVSAVGWWYTGHAPRTRAHSHGRVLRRESRTM